MRPPRRSARCVTSASHTPPSTSVERRNCVTIPGHTKHEHAATNDADGRIASRHIRNSLSQPLCMPFVFCFEMPGGCQKLTPFIDKESALLSVSFARLPLRSKSSTACRFPAFARGTLATKERDATFPQLQRTCPYGSIASSTSRTSNEMLIGIGIHVLKVLQVMCSRMSMRVRRLLRGIRFVSIAVFVWRERRSSGQAQSIRIPVMRAMPARLNCGLQRRFSAMHCNHYHNTQRNLRPMRVLLVEDDDLIGCGVEAGLRQAGFTVDWARDGHKAGLALATTSYALVVLDLGLPRVSGMDLLKRLRDAGNDVPGARADGARHGGRPRQRSGSRRRRLPRQAFDLTGTDRRVAAPASPRARPQCRADPLSATSR